MNYIISGKVIRGDGYGRKIGFPTVNLDREYFLKMKKRPDFGVYAGIVVLDGKKYKSGIVIGLLDGKKLPKIEAHLIGYNGNAYGKEAIFEIKQFIRKFENYESEEALIRQIKKDLEKCLQE